ncbi:hypothetical protein CSC17_1475 [Klebsiella oxytoca]|nr:hypothetical protein CSC17_1475 [Klebsiella oxytoca]
MQAGFLIPRGVFIGFIHSGLTMKRILFSIARTRTLLKFSAFY